ncbi:MAG: hypothetical protein LBV75_04560, partial [Paludibacter sp.]|nr:hypothetical protein [Paludibacter sp.]
MNDFIKNAIRFVLPSKSLRVKLRNYIQKISGRNLYIFVSGANNKIIIIEDGKEYVNDFKKIPQAIKINISGNNNTVRLHSPIAKNIYIIIGTPETKSHKSNDNYVEIFPIKITQSAWLNINIQRNNNSLIMREETVITVRCSMLMGNAAKLEIGRNCLIANVKFALNDFHKIYDIETNQVINQQKNHCIIGEHCWFANDTTVLKNAQIPENCVIGLGSIV